MNNILSNLIKSVFSNPITVFFLIIIVLYSVWKFIESKNLYSYIAKNSKELESNHNNNNIYRLTKNKYNIYKTDKNHGEVNIASLIEEVASEMKYKDKFLLDIIKSIKSTSANCILLGVLGTFIGLSTMLLSVDTNNLINSLPATISSMQTAFITSILGIIASISITYALRVYNCEHSMLQIMLRLENLLTLETSDIKSKLIDNKIEDVKNTIKHISKSIESIEKFDKISKDLNDFNDQFISGIESLKDLMYGSANSIKTFDQSIRKLDKQFSILNLKFNKIFDKYDNQENINSEILLEIKETSKNIHKTTDSQIKIRDHIGNLNAVFALYEKGVQDLITKLIEHDDKVILNQRELKDNRDELSSCIHDLSDIITSTSDDIQDKIELMFSYIDIYNEAMSYNGRTSLIRGEYVNEEEIYEIEEDEEDDESFLLKYREMYTNLKDKIDEVDLND